jgi:hypothetical protein
MKKELDGMSPTLPRFTEKHEKLLKRAKDNLDAMDKMRQQQDEF